MVGAYIGWLCITYLGTPLPVTLAAVVIGCGLLGMAIERIGLRPLQGSPRIAPLLSTIGIGLVLDQIFQLLFTPDPRGVPLQLPEWRLQIGGGTIGALDILIAGIGLVSALALYLFLRFTKLGWAVRATALDRDAAQQCGVDVNRVNSVVFAIAAALGGVSRLPRRHVLQLDRSQHGLSRRPEGHRRADDRRHGQRAGRDRRLAAARPDRELWHRGVRHQLPQPVRLRGDDPDPGAQAQRHFQPRARPAARAAHRHLHRAERAGAHSVGRGRGARGDRRWRCRWWCATAMCCRRSASAGFTRSWRSASRWSPAPPA